MAEYSRLRPTSINLTDDQHRDLRLIAERRLSSVSQVVRVFVAEAVEREKRGDEEQSDGR